MSEHCECQSCQETACNCPADYDVLLTGMDGQSYHERHNDWCPASSCYIVRRVHTAERKARRKAESRVRIQP
jgi:hypothetical protein